VPDAPRLNMEWIDGVVEKKPEKRSLFITDARHLRSDMTSHRVGDESIQVVSTTMKLRLLAAAADSYLKEL